MVQGWLQNTLGHTKKNERTTFSKQRCTHRLLEKNCYNKIIKIIFDSEGALKALDSYSIESKLVGNYLDDLKRLSNNNRATPSDRRK